MYLAKVGLLRLMRDLPGEKLTTLGVKKEVVDEGKEVAAKDALMVERILQEKAVKIEKITDKKLFQIFSAIPELHETDAEVLTLAKERDGIAIMDDKVARETAKIYGIEYGGTALILALLIRHGMITKETAKSALNDMISLGWRCSAEEYSHIVKMIDET
ncbi:MAG: DUF3368 domain-containing protein [Methanocellales archaeon]|nr:DUF3368 domain-containing protein [Methanocellales archaeon]